LQVCHLFISLNLAEELFLINLQWQNQRAHFTMLLEDKSQPLSRTPTQVYDIIELSDTEDRISVWSWCKTKLPHLIGTPLSILSWAFSLRFLLLLWRSLWDGSGGPGTVAACYFGTQVSLLSKYKHKLFHNHY
jgi:hypothetical protein